MGGSLFPRSPGVQPSAASFPYDRTPLCLLPGQWWVSVGTDNLVSVFSMPMGTTVVQVRGWGRWAAFIGLSPGVQMQRPPAPTQGPRLNLWADVKGKDG